MNMFLNKKNAHFITIFYLFQNIQVFTYMSYNKINKTFEKKDIPKCFSSRLKMIMIILM